MNRRAALGLIAFAIPGAAPPSLSWAQLAPGLSSRGGRLIFTAVKAGGAAGDFLVDTGAPTTVLDLKLAAAAGVRLGEPQVLMGGGRATVARIAEDITVQPKDGPPRRLDASVADLSSIGAIMGRPLAGILGGDYFATLALALDFALGAARFAEAGAAAPPAEAEPIRILATPFVRAAVEIAGRRAEGLYQIDTGANLAALIWAPYARRAFPGLVGTPGQSMGIAGISRSRLVKLDALEVGGRRLEGDLSADIGIDSRPDDAGRDYAGALGAAAFTGHILHIDYVRARMWVG